MKHLRKYNESQVPFDVEFLNSVFAEFLDQEDVQSEFLEGTYWEILIPIPRWSKNRNISDYVEVSSKIDEIMKDIQVAMNRVDDEYGGDIIFKIDEENSQDKWWLHITYEHP